MEKETQKLTSAEKKAAKLEAKIEKAEARKEELADKIEELRVQILDEKDEKVKNTLRDERLELIAERESIINSKDGATIPMSKKTKAIIKAAVAIVVCCAILVTYVATGAVRKGPVASLGLPQSTVTGVVITDNDGKKHNVKVATYNYYFAMQYNNLRSTQQMYSQYGIELSDEINVDFDKPFSSQTTTNHDGEVVSWTEYMKDEVFENILSTYTYYYEALKANDGKEPEIKEDQQKEIDEAIENYKKSADKYGFTVSAYLTAAMGKGVTEKLFREEAKIAYIAQNYQKDYNNKLLEKEYTEDDYAKYQEDNKSDLETVNIKVFEAENEDTATKFFKELKADGSNFASLASKYASDDWDKEANKNPVETTYNDVTKATLKGLGYAVATADDDNKEKFSGLDWLYSTDRKAGDKKQFTTTVVYVTKPVNISNTTTVSVRHILVTPFFADEEKKDDAKATEASNEKWDAAYAEAQKILDEWKGGEATAESFGALAKEHTEDSNGDDGGLYENITPNKMVSTFNAWCFDSARNAGDTGIVKTEFGYHIIYFESKGDMPVWKYTAQQALASEDGKDASKKLEDSYSIKQSWFGSRYFEKDTDIDN